MGPSPSKPRGSPNNPSPILATIAPISAPVKRDVPELVFQNITSNGTVTTSYKVLEELGSGAFGKVYKVIDKQNSKVFALKLIKGLDNQQRQDAMREIEMLKSVNHPNIVKYHTSFSLGQGQNQALCIVMEFVEGFNLQKLFQLQSAPLPLEWVMKMFIELLQIFAFLQKNCVVHCDVKPANLLIVTNQEDSAIVKLVDFGLATRVAAESGTLTQIGGTTAYLAPEVLLSQIGKPTLKVDIWALGLVLYEALTLDTSFAKEPFGWYSYIQNDKNVLQRNIGDIGLQALLSMMLEINPRNRKTATEILESDVIKGWEQVLNVDHPDRQKTPATVLFLSSFVSVLNKKCSGGVIQSSLSYINSHLKVLDVRRALLQIKAVTKLCLLLRNDKSQLPDDIRKKLAKLNETQMDLENVDSESAMELILLACLPKPLRESVLHILKQLLQVPPYSEQTAREIYCSGCLTSLLEDFKSQPDSMGLLLSLLCRHSCTEYSLQKQGIEYLTIASLQPNDPFSRNAMFIYEELKFHSDPNGLLLYLDHLLSRPSERARSRLTDLIWARKNSNYLITASNSIIWNRTLTLCNSDLTQISDRWLVALMRLIYPVDQLVIYALNRQECTRNLTGNSPLEQTLFNCDTCNEAVRLCLSCARRCHSPNHKLRAITTRNNCSCATQACCANTPSGKVPAVSHYSNRNLISVPHTYHKVPGIQIIPGKGKIRIPKQQEETESSFILIQDKGIIIQNGDRDAALFYFEVFIRSIPLSSGIYTGVIAIGLSTARNIKDVGASKHLLGWRENEYGYHGDDGKYFCGSSAGRAYGSSYGNGDVIGCGVSGDRKIFFTCNGCFLGFTSSTIDQNVTVYASVSCSNSGMDVVLNYSDNLLFDPRKGFEGMRVNNEATKAMFHEIRSPTRNGNIAELFRVTLHQQQDIIGSLLAALQRQDPDTFRVVIERYPYLNRISVPSVIQKLFTEVNIEAQNAPIPVIANFPPSQTIGVNIPQNSLHRRSSPEIIASPVESRGSINPAPPSIANSNSMAEMLSNPQLIALVQQLSNQLNSNPPAGQSPTASPSTSHIGLGASPTKSSVIRPVVVPLECKYMPAPIKLLCRYQDLFAEVNFAGEASLSHLQLVVRGAFNIEMSVPLTIYVRCGDALELIAATDKILALSSYSVLQIQ